MRSLNFNKIVFRVDASLEIGTGHVMRCLTLAEALKKKDIDCYFICRKHPGNLIDFISNQNFKVFSLPLNDSEELSKMPKNKLLNHYSWLGSSWQDDANQTNKILENLQIDYVIVDHYALDKSWETSVIKKCKKLMVIDDLCDRFHECDILLDQNFGRQENEYTSLVPNRCLTLAGSGYALLRPEFALLRNTSLERREKPELNKILITMGGVDKDNTTCDILNAINDCKLPANINITVIMGPKSPWLDKVHKLIGKMKYATEILTNVNNMAQHMSDSDLAIGAGGSTSWERCCLGLPSLVVVLADNQKEIAKSLDSAGAAKMINKNSLIEEISIQINNIQDNILILKDISKAASIISNGRGANYVVDSILEENKI